MSNIIGLELNRAYYSESTLGDLSFTAIKLPRQNDAIKIKSIAWGCIVPTAGDRTAFLNQYVAIWRNSNIEASLPSLQVSAISVAPITNSQITGELLFCAVTNNLPDNNVIDFAEGFDLNGGNDYLIIVPPPRLSGAIAGTIFTYLSVNAKSIDVGNNPSGWRLR